MFDDVMCLLNVEDVIVYGLVYFLFLEVIGIMKL